jgi:hypothetical protein
MYDYILHQKIKKALLKLKIGNTEEDLTFYSRLIADASVIKSLYDELYHQHPEAVSHFELLISALGAADKKKKCGVKKKRCIES